MAAIALGRVVVVVSITKVSNLSVEICLFSVSRCRAVMLLAWSQRKGSWESGPRTYCVDIVFVIAIVFPFETISQYLSVDKTPRPKKFLEDFNVGELIAC